MFKKYSPWAAPNNLAAVSLPMGGRIAAMAIALAISTSAPACAGQQQGGGQKGGTQPAQAPAARGPSAKSPVTQAPATKAPAPKAPVAKESVAKVPASQAPPAKTPAAQAPATLATGPMVDACSLYQTSSVLGDKDVLVTSRAIKITDRKNGLGVIAQAPSWKVYVVNPRAKRICIYTATKFPGIGNEVRSITGGISLATLPLKRGAKSSVSGVPAITCETTKDFTSKQEKDGAREFAGPRFVKWAQLMIADQGALDKIPRQAKTILCRFYGLPEFSGQGTPLQFKYVDVAEQLHTLLLTNTSVALKVPANTFDKPSDYTVVADMAKLDNRPKIVDNGPKPAQIIKKKGLIH